MMKIRLIFLYLFCMQSTLALAGRPLFTDDASLTQAHSCQLETWWQASKNAHEFWALPACNPLGNVEVTAGINTLNADDSALTRHYILQGKTLFKPLEDGSYGYGVAFGITRPDAGYGGTDYAYIPLSIASGDGLNVVHLNIGWLQDRAANDQRITWGLGLQHSLNERFSAFGEVFGDSATDPIFHAGGSFAIIPERVQLDITYGHGLVSNNSAGFYSVGINIYLP